VNLNLNLNVNLKNWLGSQGFSNNEELKAELIGGRLL
jgi:hypothetical protein